jgi:hypothetical protein
LAVRAHAALPLDQPCSAWTLSYVGNGSGKQKRSAVSMWLNARLGLLPAPLARCRCRVPHLYVYEGREPTYVRQ